MLILQYSQMELRLWNSTIGFVFIAWGLSLVVSLMLILQLSDTIKGFQTSYTQTAINAVNFIIPIFLITAYFLFLDLPSGSYYYFFYFVINSIYILMNINDF